MAAPRGKVPKSLKDRIRESVTISAGGCWEWTKVTNQRGYGLMWVGSRVDGSRRLASAHRVAFAEFVRLPDPDLQIDHLCRNHKCVNPEHLEEVTARVNTFRGTSPSSVNAQKTHCLRGHEFTPENTRVNKGKRYCRECAETYRARRRNAI